MATAVTPVSQQDPWKRMDDTADYMDDTLDLSDPKRYNHSNTAWTSEYPTETDQRAVIDLTTEANSFLLKFYGDPKSVAVGTETGNLYVGLGAVWGIAKLEKGQASDEYVGEYLGAFELVVGNDEVGTSSILPQDTDPDTAVWIRDISVTEDRSIFPAFRIIGQEGDAAPVLAFDSMGYSQIVVELRCKVPAGYSSGGLTINAPSGLGFIWRVL